MADQGAGDHWTTCEDLGLNERLYFARLNDCASATNSDCSVHAADEEEVSADADGGFNKNKITEIIYTLDVNLKIHEIAMTYDQADKILLKARDEAHRFANSYRKKQMSKERK